MVLAVNYMLTMSCIKIFWRFYSKFYMMLMGGTSTYPKYYWYTWTLNFAVLTYYQTNCYKLQNTTINYTSSSKLITKSFNFSWKLVEIFVVKMFGTEGQLSGCEGRLPPSASVRWHHQRNVSRERKTSRRRTPITLHNPARVGEPNEKTYQEWEGIGKSIRMGRPGENSDWWTEINWRMLRICVFSLINSFIIWGISKILTIHHSFSNISISWNVNKH